MLHGLATQPLSVLRPAGCISDRRQTCNGHSPAAIVIGSAVYPGGAAPCMVQVAVQVAVQLAVQVAVQVALNSSSVQQCDYSSGYSKTRGVCAWLGCAEVLGLGVWGLGFSAHSATMVFTEALIARTCAKCCALHERCNSSPLL